LQPTGTATAGVACAAAGAAAGSRRNEDGNDDEKFFHSTASCRFDVRPNAAQRAR
jgi:hypothetical protein